MKVVALSKLEVSALEVNEKEYICASGEYSKSSSDEPRHEVNNNMFKVAANSQGKYLDIICFKNIVHHF